MDKEKQKIVAREISRKLREIEATKSSDSGSTSSTTGQQKLRQKRKFGFFRIFFALIVAIGVGGVVAALTTNAFKQRQKEMAGVAPIIKAAQIDVTKIEFGIVSEAGNSLLKVRATLQNTGNAPGTIGRASFDALDRNGNSITSWPSPLLVDHIAPGTEQVIESSFFEPPEGIASVSMDLQAVISQ